MAQFERLARDLEARVDDVQRAHAVLGDSWTDEHYRHSRGMVESFMHAFRQGLADVDRHLGTLRHFSTRLDAVLDGSAAGHSVGSASAADRVVGREPQVPAVRAFARIATMRSFAVPAHKGRFFVLDPSMFRRNEFAWGTHEPGITFAQTSHHGLVPNDYRNIVKQAGMVIDAGAAGTEPCGSMETAWNAFIRSEPIRLDQMPDGTIDIIDGQHRLWAAFELGLAVPVQLVSRPRV